MTGFKLFIEDPINYLLATIPEAEEHLEKLEGQRIEILIHETKRPFQLHFQGLSVHITESSSTKPNVILSGKSLGLLETLVTGKTGKSVTIDGNESTLLSVLTLVSLLPVELIESLPFVLTGKRFGSPLSAGEELSRFSLKFKDLFIEGLMPQALSVFSSNQDSDYFYSELSLLRDRIDDIASRLENLLTNHGSD
jgi:ubiquinone biosynthesis protein UbiJ